MRFACIPLIILIGCTTHVQPVAPATPKVTHVVIVWLKSPGDESARQKMIDASRTFRSIPGVVRVSAGRAIPSTRPVVDASFDVAIAISFKDTQSLRAYDSHPIHKQAVENILRPLVAKQIVYDLIDE